MPEPNAATIVRNNNTGTGVALKGDGEQKKPACKACCACPETKRVRDACIIENGEENCQDLIEAHKKCMRDMGFNI